MKVTLVHVDVMPDHVEDFIEASGLNHLASIEEPGNCRFDILQSSDDSSKFILYEAYATDEAAAAHKQSENYLRSL